MKLWLNPLPLLLAALRKGKALSKNLMLQLRSYFQNQPGKLRRRFEQDQSRKTLQKLPWYLILGTPQSGIKHFLANTGLYFMSPENFGSEAKALSTELPEVDWWFAEQAVLIDAMSTDQNRNLLAWQQLLKILKRLRRKRPVNGLVLSLALPDILKYTPAQRQTFLQDVCKYIRDLHHHFSSQTPVYLMITKCDLIEGFVEFFNDLSKEELAQVWGLTFPLAEGQDAPFVRKFFHEEFSRMVNILRERVLWSLDAERTMRGRELIHSFPQQLQLLKQPVDQILAELFSAARLPKILKLRGLYFTSSTQESDPMDFLLQAMSKKFQLLPPKIQRPKRVGEIYFLKKLFSQIILAEASLLGESENAQKSRSRLIFISKIAAPSIILFGGLCFYQAYQGNLRNLASVSAYLEQYQAAAASIKPEDAAPASLLPLLNPLSQAILVYETDSAWSPQLLYLTHFISARLNTTLDRALANLYLPRIAATLEGELQQNIADPNILYATLKAYLAFSASDYTKSSAILAPMEYLWAQSYPNQTTTTQALSQYLKRALGQSITKLPLDPRLITQIRSKLETIVPGDRAYGLLALHASVSDLAPLNIVSASGGHFAEVFVGNSEKLTIPALYTFAGFNNIFLKEYRNVAEEVAQDNHDIGLAQVSMQYQNVASISATLEKLYAQHYIDAWSEALQAIHLRPVQQLNQGLAILDSLLSKTSPLNNLLNLVDEQTASISEGSIQVSQHFAALHLANAEWSKTENLLAACRQLLANIQASPKPDLAAFNFLKAAFNSQDNAIFQLADASQKLPQPLRGWVKGLADLCWQLILNQAHHYLNDRWQEEIQQPYQNGLADRFPIESEAKTQIALEDFSDFFGPQGHVENFFNHYLRFFVNTDHAPWSLLETHAYTFELAPSALAAFEQSQILTTELFNANQASIRFTLKPLMLSTSAAGVIFHSGNSRILYQHGPQTEISVSWPLPRNDESSEIIISDFHDARAVKAYQGPWSLFQLLQAGDLRKTQNPGQYFWMISLQGKTAEFLINTSSKDGISAIQDLENFTLPEQLFETSETHHDDAS